jgi:anti-anti-sigma regulatory factor
MTTTQLSPPQGSREELADGGRETFDSGLTMDRAGRRACVRITGQASAITHRHLDEWLDWLIMTGARQVTVALAAADQIDTRLVQVLGIARARLRDSDAELVVTAAGSPMRSELWGHWQAN